MTRLAKAMSAFNFGRSGSADGRDARSFAGRGASLRANGSSAPAAALKPRDLHYRFSLAAAALLIAMLAALVLGASSASAATKVPIFDFGSLNSARGIAINESGSGGVDPGTVYVAEFHASNGNRISVFDADGELLEIWGWDVIATGDGDHPEDKFEICVPANGEVCKAGEPGGGAGQFAALAGGLAVNQSNGDVYVLDRGNFRVQQLSATGAFIRTWGKDVNTGGNTTDFETCVAAEAANCKAGTSGTGAGMFNFGTLAIASIATDSTGNVYVPDPNNARVQKFSPSGGFLAMAGWNVDSTSLSTEYEVCTEAADCQAGTAGENSTQFASTGANSTTPGFLATSPAGDVYVVARRNGTIYRLTSALAFGEEYPASTSTSTNPNRNAIAVNPADGHVFFGVQSAIAAGGTSNIYELDPGTGTIVGTHPAEGDQWVGLAVNGATGRMYGTRTTTAAFVRAFEEGPPTPVSTPVSGNTGTKATLNGTVNPNGVGVTECFFEWGTTTAYGHIAQCDPEAAGLGEGTDPESVQADITGLVPNGTTYHYRLVAENAHPTNGKAESANQSFTTPNTVVTQAASPFDDTTATLHGTVNPDGVAIAECVFEWGTTTNYGSEIDCDPAAGDLSGTNPVAVEADLTGLNGGTPYHFRLKATYAEGIGAVNGANQSFQTLGPRVVATWSEDVTLTEAVLKAQIDPEGVATTYRFEYGNQGPCASNPCAIVPDPDGPVGSDSSVHTVKQSLDGLQPGVTYHFRVVATDSNDAINFGPDLTLDTYASLAPRTDCSNQAFRIGPSAALPNCRAYEMVSPVDKAGGGIVAAGSLGLDDSKEAAFKQASGDGNRVTYASTSAFGDVLRSARSNQYLSSRVEGEGWGTHALYPPLGIKVMNFDFDYDGGLNFQAFTPDLCLATMRDHNLTPLTPDALNGFVNLYLRDNCGPAADTYRALTTGVPPTHSGGFPAANILPEGRVISRDHGTVVFMAQANLESTPASANNPQFQIYEQDLAGGGLRLVSVLPGGTADTATSWLGSFGGSAGAPRIRVNLDRAVSSDGSRIYWTSGSATLYVRIGGAETVQVASGSSPRFWTASLDGSKAIYSQGANLFEFDLDKALAEEPGASTQIAGGFGGVAGASESLSHLYFSSTQDLAEGAIAGRRNLYLRHDGEIRLVATLAPGNGDSLTEIAPDHQNPFERASRVSPDGHLAFMSLLPLTGADNTDAASGQALRQVFVYDPFADLLRCASCRPSGARPSGRILNAPYQRLPSSDGFERWAASWIPTHEWTSHSSRVLSDDGGRLYFHSFDALVPEDRNGVQDLYEWEAPGKGECTTSHQRYSARNGGCVSLISTGRSPEDSTFLDASANGRDVFFTTASSIDPRDIEAVDVYNARVGGGFPPPDPAAPECAGDACQPVPTPPATQNPSSLSFRGPGNQAQGQGKPRCRPNQVRRGKRCVAKRKIARRACAKRKGKAKQRCVSKQMRRLNRTGRAGR